MKRAESDLEGLPIHPREAKVAEADEAARHEHVRRLDVAVEHLRRSDEIRAEMHVEMSCDHRREYSPGVFAELFAELTQCSWQ